MAHQDYVKRPRAAKKKKKNNPYQNQPEAVSHESGGNTKSKFIIAIILVIVGAAAYGLWLLKNDPKTKQPIEIITKKESKQSKKLPKPPKEKWAYRDTLENKHIDVGEYQVKQGGPYKMQCGSFRTLKQAEVLKATIAFTGLEALIQQAKGESGMWYKVVLGPYERKRTAEKDKHQLKNNNVNRCKIWNWK